MAGLGPPPLIPRAEFAVVVRQNPQRPECHACYTTSLYLIDLKCALNFGEAQEHHPGYLESINHWFARWEKQALDFRGQLHVLKQVVTLLLNSFGEFFPPCSIYRWMR
jgi:hypothetical protein